MGKVEEVTMTASSDDGIKVDDHIPNDFISGFVMSSVWVLGRD